MRGKEGAGRIKELLLSKEKLYKWGAFLSFMDGLEGIIQHYKEQVEEVIKVVEAGDKYTFDSQNFYRSWFVKEIDFNVRVKGAFSLIYDTLQSIKAEDETLLSRLSEKVRNPVLDEAFKFLDGSDGSDSEKERFVNELSQDYQPTSRHGFNMKLIAPLRALFFLEVMKHHPEKVDQVRSDSMYIIHRLFRGERKKSPSEVTREVEEDIAATLPTLYSERLQELVPRINEFIERGNYGFAGSVSKNQKLGKYTLCQGFRFREGVSEKSFDELFSDEDTKREIMYTLAECLILTSQSAQQHGRRAKNLPRFGVPSTHYGLAVNNLRAYARNQILSVFKKTEGEAVANTFLTRYMKLRGEMVGETLTVHDSFTNCSERLNRDSHFVNTSGYLPLCVAILDSFYQKSVELSSPRPQ